MEYARSESSDQYERYPSLSAKSDDIGFRNAMGSLNQTKCFMVMAIFMDLHGIQKLCLHCRTIHKNACVYTIHTGKEPCSIQYQGR